ncbi:pilus assembly protein PilM [Desulfurispora thermophila]|uniref:pilus assembly protein PilM n=1 Tax=Desulfurispora thermophila TaxID=265470 RepID=UPI000368D1AF|nr:pilus assembly protein PilM [Desulfurispora thermophila]
MSLFNKYYAGIDVGSQNVKVVLITQTRRQWELVEQHLLPRPAEQGENFSNSSLTEAEPNSYEGQENSTLTGILARLADNPLLKKAAVVSALPGHQVLTRHIMLPPMPDKDIAKALAFELEKILPGNTGHMITRHVNLGRVSTPEGPQQHVLLAAAPREEIYQHYNLFHQAGLKLVAVDLAQLALWRVFGPGSPFQAGAAVYAVVDIGHENTHLLIIKSGRLAFTRTLNTGGRQVLETLAVMLGTDSAGALNLLQSIKESPGREILPVPNGVEPVEEPFHIATAENNQPVVKISGELLEDLLTGEGEPINNPPPFPSRLEAAAAIDQADVSAALTTALAELLREIRRSLDFYKLQDRQSELEKIIITGGAAQLPLLAETATSELGLPTEIGYLTLPNDCQLEPNMSIAYGLALREISK